MVALDGITQHYKGKDAKLYAADQWVHEPKRKTYLHIFHRRHGAYENKIEPVFSAAPDDFHPSWTEIKRRLFQFYNGSRLHLIYEHAKRNLTPLPFPSFQLYPVIFCLELDSRGSSKKAASLYDEVFTLLLEANHDQKYSKTHELVKYIATADIIILNRAGLKNSPVHITEGFEAFVAKTANSVIAVADGISEISDTVRRAFRSIYSQTALKYVPIMVLLVREGADMQDYNWQDRHASSETMLLREVLLEFGTICMPHKVFFVRPSHVVEDVEHALFWLWRKSGVRDRKKPIPISTSTTKKRWEPLVIARNKQRSTDASHRKHTSLASAKSILSAERLRKRKVRFNPVPVDIDRKVGHVQSLGSLVMDHCAFSMDDSCLTKTPEKPAKPRKSRSLSPTELRHLLEDNPDFEQEIRDLCKKRVGSRFSPNLLSPSGRPGDSRSAGATSQNIANTILEGQEEKKLREKFAVEEIKYLELRTHERRLEEEQRHLRLKIDLLVSELQAVKSNILQTLPPLPTFSEYEINGSPEI